MSDDAKLIEQALARLREGTEILRTGGAGAKLTPTECGAVLDAVERLTAERDALSVGLNEVRKQAESAEDGRDRLAADIQTAINELSGGFSSRTAAVLTLRAALAEVAQP